MRAVRIHRKDNLNVEEVPAPDVGKAAQALAVVQKSALPRKALVGM
ncbi:hypothetical protein QEV69_01270 [Trueperella pyogenes]|nr:hypothetical protein [Trueperella pyogenes]AJC70694.1 hypothetical protein X956_08890 [Trueperella pyogenes TP8]MBB3025134.1 hypothetical protein [Trueperella pyogenes]MCI7690633.1 hypothetical protein [Trueperella pyogenes]QIU87630.1 hypothetical protein HEP79_10725 [Trueperella pyogenes]UVJ54072.1 hypothetical protein K5713_01825 [Trueperella pyogenes]